MRGKIPDRVPMIHKIYQTLLPLCIRTAIGQIRNSLRRCGWKCAQAIAPTRWWLMRKRVSTHAAHRKRLVKLGKLLKTGKPITVVFEVTGTSKWKADSLLLLMQAHPRIKPVVWHIPYNDPPSPEREEFEIRQCEDHFPRLGVDFVTYPSLKAFPADEKPDIIFVSEPYDPLVTRSYHKGILGYLFCYLPYSYTCTFSAKSRNLITPNGALGFFVENETSREQCQKLMDNHAVNVTATGHPMADSFLFPKGERLMAWRDCGSGLKRVIWAPHWSINDNACWLISIGTFPTTAEILLEMAEKYRGQIQFAFKPHPNLYDTLCKHPQWGKVRTDAFYAKWREMPNTQLETGEYVDLFMQSDAMIHDSGSFIQEYLFADKPCMYLKYPENRQEYSAMAADCLNAYQFGITREDIEAFLQMVLRGEDPKAGARRELREKYLVPPNGKSAAENILNHLLTSHS